MTTFYPIELKCPVCGTDFPSEQIGSCGHASKRTDFRPNYWGGNPTNFMFHLCPTCGFCAAITYFEKEWPTHDIKQKIAAIGPLQNSSLPQKLAQAAKCLEAIRESGLETLTDFNLANTWIQAYWWSEHPRDIANFGNIVLSYFQKAFQVKTIPPEEIPTIIYLMGEIHRRLGHKADADTCFDKAIALAANNEKLQFIAKMAKQQKEDPKENFD